MGCFLGCFGVSTKRKRRKPANRILPGPADSKLVSYVPLDSFINVDDDPEDSIVSKSQLSNKPKERSSVKIRKKVSFNLNVQTYEPIPDEETTTYRFLQSVEEEEESEKNEGEAGKGSLPFLSDGVSSSMQTSSYPCNYRYQNCRESFDEEDEMLYEESDIEEVDDDDDDSFYDDDDDGDQFESLNMDSANGASLIPLDEDNKSKDQMPLCGSTDGSNARIRSQYLCSVLSPIENTTQWKEIKARAATKPKQMRKENVEIEEESQIPLGSNPRSDRSSNYNQSKPLLQDIAVDASLSNWLISPNINKSEITGRTKSCSITFDTLQSMKSREDRVILDITNL